MLSETLSDLVKPNHGKYSKYQKKYQNLRRHMFISNFKDKMI